MVLLHEAIRIDDTQRVAHAIEGPDLQQDRLVAQHVQAVELQHLLAPRHLAVAVRQRVDGRMDHEARDRERPGELRQGEDRRVIPLGRRPERAPDLGLRRREIAVVRPHPAARAAAAVHDQQGARIVHHDQVRVEPQAPRIVGAGVAQAPEHALRDDLLRARQGPADRARDRIEVGAADRDLPARVDAEVVQDGNEPVQGLDDGPGIARRAHVDESPAPQPLADAQEEVHGAARSHLAVVVELHGRALGHQRASRSSASVSTRRWRSRMRSRLPTPGSMCARRSASSWDSSVRSTHSTKSLRPCPAR